MHPSQRDRDPGVRQSAQKSRLCFVDRGGAKRLDQQDLDEALEDEVTADVVARRFHANGWTVIATMRTPREALFEPSDRLRILSLDVTRADSIAAAIEAAGPIDVLVNNAGIGVVGAFGVRAKLVEPGHAPTTRFSENSDIPLNDLIPNAYADFPRPVLAEFATPTLTPLESDVAEAVWRAASDASDRLRYPAGADAVALAQVM